MNRAIFLDRDNTIVRQDGDEHDVERVTLVRGAAHALASLRQLGFRIIVVANEGAVARGIYSEDDVDAVHQRVAQLAHEAAGAIIDRFYYCPFHPEGTVNAYRQEHAWRKPKPGMLLQAAKDLELDLGTSWMVGDHGRDIEAGAAAGCRTILIGDAGQTKRERRADFEVSSLAEAAAVIAHHRQRARELTEVDPIVVAKVSSKVVPAPEKTKQESPPLAVEAVIEVALNAAVAPARDTTPPKTDETAVSEEAVAVAKRGSKGETKGKSKSKRKRKAKGKTETTSGARNETGNSDVEKKNHDVMVEENPAEKAKTAVGDPASDPDENTVVQADVRAEAGAEESVEVAGEAASARANVAVPVDAGATDAAEAESVKELRPGYFALPAVQTKLEAKAQTEGRTDRLLLDLLSEIRSWRARSGEFTALRLFAFAALAVIMMGALAAAIYLPGNLGLVWVGVTLVAQLTVIAVLLLNPRG